MQEFLSFFESWEWILESLKICRSFVRQHKNGIKFYWFMYSTRKKAKLNLIFSNFFIFIARMQKPRNKKSHCRTPCYKKARKINKKYIILWSIKNCCFQKKVGRRSNAISINSKIFISSDLGVGGEHPSNCKKSFSKIPIFCHGFS